MSKYSEEIKTDAALHTAAKLYPYIRSLSKYDGPNCETSDGLITAKNLDSLVQLCDRNAMVVDLSAHLDRLGLIQDLGMDSQQLIVVRKAQLAHYEKQLIEQLKLICGVFNDANIDYVLLKGAGLVAGGYTSVIGQRYLADIDVLVLPSDLDRVLQVMQGIGFSTELKLIEPVSSYWKTKHLPPLSRNGFRYRVECHQKPFEHTFRFKSPYSTEEVMSSRCVTNIEDINVFVPCAEHLLLSSFYHSQIFDIGDLARRDNYRAMLDVSLILRSRPNNFDWGLVSTIVESRNYTRAFHRFLNRTLEIFDPTLLSLIDLSLPDEKSATMDKLIGRNSKRGSLFFNCVLHAREIARAASSDGRMQRKMLLQANPDNWKYLPIYRQLISPNAIKERLKYFLFD